MSMRRMKTTIYVGGKLAEADERGKSAKKVIRIRTSSTSENSDPTKGYVC
jgi:hypothetical protein